VQKEARLRQQPMSPLLAGKIVADAAEGLHFAHELADYSGNHLGIVHRDVSPGNIVVQYNGVVKVVDFGIAKAHGRVTSTQEGELKGKYGYMAPEQIKNEPMDKRSDVFSLGVVLWEALAQRRLFYADNVAATLMQILTADRVPPSHFFPQIPHALDVACLRALAPNPNDRFQSVAEMKQAIDDAVWQARIGIREVETYMNNLYAERMSTRKGLLARATAGALSPTELEQLGTAFRDGMQLDKATSAQSPGARGSLPPQMQQTVVPPQMQQTVVPAQMQTMVPPQMQSAPQAATVMFTPAGAMPALPQSGSMPPLPPGESGHILQYPVGQRPMFFDENEQDPEPVSRLRPFIVIIAIGVVLGVIIAMLVTMRRNHAAPVVAQTPPPPVTEPAKPAISVTPLTPDPPPVQQLAITPDAMPAMVVDAAPVVEIDAAVVEEKTTPPEKTPIAEKKPPVQKKPPVVVQAKEPREPKETPKKDVSQMVKDASAAYLEGDFSTAETWYKKAVAANKNYAPAWRGLGLAYQSTGKNKAAIAALKRYLDLSPNAKDEVAITQRIRQLGGS
jgi:serine/threonine-protein kinase